MCFQAYTICKHKSVSRSGWYLAGNLSSGHPLVQDWVTTCPSAHSLGAQFSVASPSPSSPDLLPAAHLLKLAVLIQPSIICPSDSRPPCIWLEFGLLSGLFCLLSRDWAVNMASYLQQHGLTKLLGEVKLFQLLPAHSDIPTFKPL